jgi:hypothetical protein
LGKPGRRRSRASAFSWTPFLRVSDLATDVCPLPDQRHDLDQNRLATTQSNLSNGPLDRVSAQDACVSARLFGGGERGRRLSLDSLELHTRRCPQPPALSDSSSTPGDAAAAPSTALAGSGGAGWRFAECGQRQERSHGKRTKVFYFFRAGHHEGRSAENGNRYRANDLEHHPDK